MEALAQTLMQQACTRTGGTMESVSGGQGSRSCHVGLKSQAPEDPNQSDSSDTGLTGVTGG